MTIVARYHGRCSKCRGHIRPGERINWDRATRATSHVECPPPSPPKPRPEEIAARIAAAKALAATITRREVGLPEDATLIAAIGAVYGRREWWLSGSTIYLRFARPTLDDGWEWAVVETTATVDDVRKADETQALELIWASGVHVPPHWTAR